MRKIFISQPFSGWTKDEVIEARRVMINEIIKKGYEEYGKFIVVNSLECFDIPTPLAGLGEAIKYLDKVDKAYFLQIEHDIGIYISHAISRGCCIELEVCKKFDIPVQDVLVKFEGYGIKPIINKES